LEAHITACARCSGEAARLEHLIRLMRTDTAEDAPPSVIAGAVHLFYERASPPLASSGRRRRILAVLRFDSLGLAPAFGMRSGEPSARQILFHAEVHDIDLRIEPAPEDWTSSGSLPGQPGDVFHTRQPPDLAWIVSGQVLGETSAGGQVKLTSATSEGQARLNEQNEFTLPPVPSGSYQLILHLTNVDVEVNELKLGM
jgi:hypothetical protein